VEQMGFTLRELQILRVKTGTVMSLILARPHEPEDSEQDEVDRMKDWRQLNPTGNDHADIKKRFVI